MYMLVFYSFMTLLVPGNSPESPANREESVGNEVKELYLQGLSIGGCRLFLLSVAAMDAERRLCCVLL